jgi:predicted DNA-binding transcriptional regulator AlpA
MEAMADEFITVEEVARKLARSIRQVWRDVSAGIMPKPFKIGPKSTRWSRNEILEHMEKIKQIGRK